MDQRTDPSLNLLDPAFRANPYPFYERMRDGGPVRLLPGGMWVVTGHAAAREALEHPDFAHWTRTEPASAPPGPGFEAVLARWFALMHPRRKSDVRRGLLALMGGEALERIATDLEDRAEALLDRAAAAGRMDVIADYARPLTLGAASDLLGLDAAEADGLAQAMRRAGGSLLAGFGHADPVQDWIAAQIDRRTKVPGQDMISSLVKAAANGESDAHDTPSFCRLLIFAATDNMTNFIGNATLGLLAAPEASARVAQTVVGADIIAELLRHDSPVQALPLTALRKACLAGTEIAQQQTVLVLIGAANRDPKAFVAPWRLSFDRVGPAALSFGSGALSCLGARLAQKTGAVALTRLFARFPTMHCDRTAVRWQAGMPMLRGPESLPVTL